MVDTKIQLKDGEVVAVVYGNTGRVKEYENHSSFVMLDGKTRDTNLSTKIPPKVTKAIVVTEGIEHMNYAWIMSFCRTNSVPYLLRKSNQAVYETLKSMLPTNGSDHKPSNEDVAREIVHGKLNPLIPLIDFTKSNAENAKALMIEAHKRQIKTTLGSMTQFVSNQRRKRSGTALPKSARPKLDVSVELLDSMIKELEDMREFLIATVEENRLLKDKYEKFKKLME